VLPDKLVVSPTTEPKQKNLALGPDVRVASRARGGGADGPDEPEDDRGAGRRGGTPEIVQLPGAGAEPDADVHGGAWHARVVHGAGVVPLTVKADVYS